MNQHENPPDRNYNDADLSRSYHALPKEQPPVALDKAIIKSARDSVKKKKKISVPLFSGWLVPLATTASIILVVGLLRLLPEDQVYQLPAQSNIPQTPEEEGAVSTLTSKRSKKTPKVERARLQDEIAPLNQAAEDIASEPKPADQQRAKELQAKGKAAAIVHEDAEEQVPLEGAEKSPARGMAPQPRPLTAQQWIKHISELIERDRIEQARIALEEFENRYPGHPGIKGLSARLDQ